MRLASQVDVTVLGLVGGAPSQSVDVTVLGLVGGAPGGETPRRRRVPTFLVSYAAS